MKISNKKRSIALVLIAMISLLALVSAASAAVSANFKATPTAGGAQLTVQFKDTSTGKPAYWTWVFGDGTSLSGSDPTVNKNPIHIYKNPGSYTVSLTIRASGSYINSTKSVPNCIIVT